MSDYNDDGVALAAELEASRRRLALVAALLKRGRVEQALNEIPVTEYEAEVEREFTSGVQRGPRRS